MNFHLQFPVTAFSQQINYRQRLLFVGSCFAEEIGGVMQDNKFNVLVNPHGILYNPASIGKALRRYINNTLLKETDLFYANECYHSWAHHSRFSNPDKMVCLDSINRSITQAHAQLKNATWVFITFGSAFYYKHTASNTMVSNCHKLPQNFFTKHLLTVEKMIADCQLLIRELLAFNTNLKIVFTVSPVRYIRDGITENTLSKARLIETVHALLDTNVFYFPAYELVMDDLRDYRFYKTDLVHPNEQAIQYVFEKLKEAAFDTESHLIFEKIQDIIKAKAHRPFNSNTQAHQQFKALYERRCLELKTAYPFLDLDF